MRPCRQRRRHGGRALDPWRVLGRLVVLSVAATAAARGLAQQITLQTQLEYQWVQTTFSDGRVDSFSRFTPLYALTLQGPVAGGTNLQINLGLSGYASTDRSASVEEHNFRIDLMAQSGHLDLLASASRDVNRTAFVLPGGVTEASKVSMDSYVLSGALAYPGYPTITLQFARNLTQLSKDVHERQDTSLLAASYDRGPFRFLASQATQSTMPGGDLSRQEGYGLVFTRSLLPSVQFSLEHYGAFGALQTGGRESGSTSYSTTARVTAQPTPFLVVDGEFGLSAGSGTGEAGFGGTNGRLYSVDLRSEVVPGVRFDVSRNSQTVSGAFGRTASDQTAIDLAAQLSANTSVLGQWSEASSHSGDALSTWRQQAAYLSLSSRLSAVTELFADLSSASQSSPDSRSQYASAGVGLVHDVSPTLATEVTYRFDHRRDTGSGGPLDDNSHSLSLDARWSPDPRWSLDGGISVSAHRDSSRGLSVNPYVEARWSPSAATTLALQYRVQQLTQSPLETPSDGLVQSQTSTGFTGGLSHQLSPNDSLELAYDADNGLGSTLTAQKQLRVSYIRTF